MKYFWKGSWYKDLSDVVKMSWLGFAGLSLVAVMGMMLVLLPAFLFLREKADVGELSCEFQKER